MKNHHLDARTTKDIDQQIDRVHRDLSYVNGKIELAEIRQLLRLDLKFYKLDDPSVVDEVIHKLKVGGRQIIERPGLLFEAVRKFDLSALFVPDRKQILIDSKVPDLKKRWYESHEIAHSLIPWHADYTLGDNRTTLSQGCHEIIEAEANYGAGRLLFPFKSFDEARRASPGSIAHVQALAKLFGNTITSTLWRYVEQSDEAVFAAISDHPRFPKDPNSSIEYFIRSTAFSIQFPELTEASIWSSMKNICGFNRTGPLGRGEIIIMDRNGQSYVFLMESFSNKHSVLTLAHLIRPVAALVPSNAPLLNFS